MKKEHKESLQKIGSKTRSLFGHRLSSKEQAFFAKRLSFLVHAGIPLLESLQVLKDQTRSRAFASILDKVIHDVSNGQFLSRSLSKFPDLFGSFAVNIIKIGEQSGILSQNLTYLAEELKKRHALKRKVTGALVYPIFITIATLGITILLTVIVFPKIMPIFLSLHVKLPLATRVVIFMSQFLLHYGIWLILFLFIGVIGTVFLAKHNARFMYLIDRTVLRMPVVGMMVTAFNLANMTRTLGLLLKSGLTLAEALPIAAETSGNLVYQEHLGELSRSVIRGAKLSSYLEKHRDIFPDLMTQMISVGEKSGSLDETFLYLSELYESDVEEFTRNLSSLIEPILMIVMGVLVGFIAVSIIMPIYEITQHLQTT